VNEHGSPDTTLGPAERQLKLSSREREIVVLLGAGRSVNDIASDLGIARGTVKTHLRRAMHKVRAADRIELMNIVGSMTHEGEDDQRRQVPTR
jgi:DNA-binding NarL/FixJ family response regulator